MADEVDNLTSEVVNAVLDVRKTPGSKEAREKLDSLRQSWASKVHELTGAIDDVIDPEDFVTISGEFNYNINIATVDLVCIAKFRGKHPAGHGTMPGCHPGWQVGRTHQNRERYCGKSWKDCGGRESNS